MASHIGTVIRLKDGREVPAPEGFNPRQPDWERFDEAALKAHAAALGISAADAEHAKEQVEE